MNRRDFIFNTLIFGYILLKTPLKVFSKIYDIKVGSKAPYFNLSGYNKNDKIKKEWSLDDFSGKWLVLYFYPKDFTSGCTIEARGFQQIIKEFDSFNASVVGISADNEDDHESFCTSENLGYTLLSDNAGEVSKAYESWLDPYSKRNTFLISPEGIIISKWIGVRPVGHSEEVLKELSKRQ